MFSPRMHRVASHWALWAAMLVAWVSGPAVTALPYAYGHRVDFANVFEGIEGQAWDDLGRRVSQGMDDEFVTLVRTRFPDVKLPGNHRLLGHWGFEGRIPFGQDPWRATLARYPKRGMAEVWQDFANGLIDDVMRSTGLPRQQAKGIAGILYNVHLLGDYVPGNKVIGPLADPALIVADISKTLSRRLIILT